MRALYSLVLVLALVVYAPFAVLKRLLRRGHPLNLRQRHLHRLPKLKIGGMD